MCVASSLKKMVASGKKDDERRQPSPWEQEDASWDNEWDSMDPVSVQVVPCATATGAHEEKDEDLFRDMQPVVMKTKKVCAWMES